MCYSALVWTNYRRYQREYGADISIHEFERLYGQRAAGARIRTPKGLDAALSDVAGSVLGGAITAWEQGQVTSLEQEIFKQRQRQANATRALATKPTQKAAEDQRIAGDKVEAALRRLGDLKRTELLPRDNRI